MVGIQLVVAADGVSQFGEPAASLEEAERSAAQACRLMVRTVRCLRERSGGRAGHPLSAGLNVRGNKTSVDGLGVPGDNDALRLTTSLHSSLAVHQLPQWQDASRSRPWRDARHHQGADRQCSCGLAARQSCCGAVADARSLGHAAALHLPAHRTFDRPGAGLRRATGHR